MAIIDNKMVKPPWSTIKIAGVCPFTFFSPTPFPLLTSQSTFESLEMHPILLHASLERHACRLKRPQSAVSWQHKSPLESSWTPCTKQDPRNHLQGVMIQRGLIDLSNTNREQETCSPHLKKPLRKFGQARAHESQARPSI